MYTLLNSKYCKYRRYSLPNFIVTFLNQLCKFYTLVVSQLNCKFACYTSIKLLSY